MTTKKDIKKHNLLKKLLESFELEEGKLTVVWASSYKDSKKAAPEIKILIKKVTENHLYLHIAFLKFLFGFFWELKVKACVVSNK